MSERPLVIGVGNEMRGDDAAGLMVAELLADRGVPVARCDGEPIALLDLWEGAAAAIVVDAVCGSVPGRIWRLDPDAEQLPMVFGGSPSTHLLGLAEVIALGRELDRLPLELTLIGIEGARFGLGAPPATAVAGAVVDVTATILAELRTHGKAETALVGGPATDARGATDV